MSREFEHFQQEIFFITLSISFQFNLPLKVNERQRLIRRIHLIPKHSLMTCQMNEFAKRETKMTGKLNDIKREINVRLSDLQDEEVDDEDEEKFVLVQHRLKIKMSVHCSSE